MTQSLDMRYRVYPGWTITTVTLTVTCLGRENRGQGNYSSAVTPVPVLSLVFTNGQNDSQTIQAIIDTIVSHCLNNGIDTWWNPEMGTPEAGIRTALETSFTPNGVAASNSLRLFFDGSFGPVFVG